MRFPVSQILFPQPLWLYREAVDATSHHPQHPILSASMALTEVTDATITHKMHKATHTGSLEGKGDSFTHMI